MHKLIYPPGMRNNDCYASHNLQWYLNPQYLLNQSVVLLHGSRHFHIAWVRVNEKAHTFMISMVIHKILEFYPLVTLLKKTAYAGYTVRHFCNFQLFTVYHPV